MLSPFVLSLPSSWMVDATTVTVDEGCMLSTAEREGVELAPRWPHSWPTRRPLLGEMNFPRMNFEERIHFPR